MLSRKWPLLLIAVAGLVAMVAGRSATSSHEALSKQQKSAARSTSGAGGQEQVTGELGSPSATTTISGKQLPAPDPKFGGVIKDTAAQSKAWWPPRVVPPKQAPNILLIMTDDSGYGVPSTFGGVIPTPALDRVAKS